MTVAHPLITSTNQGGRSNKVHQRTLAWLHSLYGTQGKKKKWDVPGREQGGNTSWESILRKQPLPVDSGLEFQLQFCSDNAQRDPAPFVRRLYDVPAQVLLPFRTRVAARESLWGRCLERRAATAEKDVEGLCEHDKASWSSSRCKLIVSRDPDSALIESLAVLNVIHSAIGTRTLS
ncbi:hypothetical protein SISSUDRAFT_19338 [Sistotremastrum suecicum HHB10207 ss-3]|uniref:Uncharacterized protein n=1 Tax=Sistotremastrum suecicum HHB10207 ss-3 TaxID=1314776 RepID=A0A166J7T8_9AGAM|nr:hypothetical protein SISSUDRAFT_19338 [Sistotremastrum suecicum HHB10207 ss-3]